MRAMVVGPSIWLQLGRICFVWVWYGYVSVGFRGIVEPNFMAGARLNGLFPCLLDLWPPLCLSLFFDFGPYLSSMVAVLM